ncbi:cytochrome c oxidase assembly protein [Croceicoccus sp. F390]|uniref:Cytochrome c oxidase assembly protein CtaG n=1 Tax=Croceicoccus esteveae TaxID=3075597 RepID=A0ABU2ZFW8_9SPHN|nr:cytochrome c oxidase assembly protein [Croceicoccus sp. F390]MDT0575251.1 cytochrome c oxidase assembly protein [Croceicoccus sp. F390]
MTALAIANNRRVGVIALLIAAAMLGLGYAAVPLYRMFCQVTGLGGTTQQATQAEADVVAVSTRMMSIRFDGNVERGMNWSFRPEHSTDNVAVGARDMAVFLARNDSDQPVTGTATFNVSPTQAGKYFNKIQCFCFTDQTLEPGQEMRMPVLYFVDPAILDDPDTKDLEQITLSYTFYQHDVAG